MVKQTGNIFDIKHFAVHDGPGIRTTVFFKGCPLSCWWCHNPESINPNPEKIGVPVSQLSSPTKCGKNIVGKEINVSEVIIEILKDVIFYDESGGGVTFSGGETLMQPDFLYHLLKECKANGIHTCVDTSGYAPRKTIEDIVDLVDLFLYDLKLIDGEEHEKYTGVTNERIIQNLEFLCEKNKKIIIRIPIIPDITDTEENITKIGEYISRLSCILRVDILPYNQFGEDKYRRLEKPYQLNNINPPTDEMMLQLKEKLEAFNLQVKIGG